MATQFRGFVGVTENENPVWVMNEGTLADGTAAYKVRLGVWGQYHGWSGGAVRRDVHYTEKTGWMAKSKIRRRRAAV